MQPDSAKARRPDPAVALLWVLAALMACAVLGVAVYKGWSLLYPETAERAPLNPDCDLRGGPCSVTFAAGGRVTLSVQPRAIPVVQPLAIEVRLRGLPAPGRVELDFAGIDMDMGFNRVELTPGDAPGRYTGSAMLPVCVRDRMTWEARVLLHLPNGILAAPFRFETSRR